MKIKEWRISFWWLINSHLSSIRLHAGLSKVLLNPREIRLKNLKKKFKRFLMFNLGWISFCIKLFCALCVMNFPNFWARKVNQQDCIPVGCVPPARWSYLLACSVLEGGCLVQGGCLIPERGLGGVCSQWGLPGSGGARSRRGTWSRGVSASGAVCLVQGGSQHALRQTRPCEQNHTRLWKHNLAPTSLWAVITQLYDTSIKCYLNRAQSAERSQDSLMTSIIIWMQLIFWFHYLTFIFLLWL